MMRVVKWLVILLVLAGLALWGGYRYWETRFEVPLSISSETLFEVPEGAGYHRVVSKLEKEGLLKDSWAYRLLTQIKPELIPSFRPGEYLLEPGMTGLDLFDVFDTHSVVTYALTIPEGWTFAQMRDALASAEKLDHQLSEMSDDDVMALLGREGEHPEGRFFPDTYRYHKGVSDADILRLALNNMDAHLEDVWAERDEGITLETPYEALIMASLIERETGAPEERREIAGVFKRRMQQGMRLQTDPTVIYGMGDAYTGNITRANLREPTPYNTYVIDGLPPTPIALPGLAALEAAVNPAEGETLYFVSRGDGTHHFSKTLREHNNAVNRYIRNR